MILFDPSSYVQDVFDRKVLIVAQIKAEKSESSHAKINYWLKMLTLRLWHNKPPGFAVSDLGRMS